MRVRFTSGRIPNTIRYVGGCAAIKMWCRNYCVGLECSGISCLTLPFMYKKNSVSVIVGSPQTFYVNSFLCLKVAIWSSKRSECTFIRCPAVCSDNIYSSTFPSHIKQNETQLWFGESTGCISSLRPIVAIDWGQYQTMAHHLFLNGLSTVFAGKQPSLMALWQPIC